MTEKTYDIDTYIAESSKSISFTRTNVLPKEVHTWKIDGYSLLGKITRSKPFKVGNSLFMFQLYKNMMQDNTDRTVIFVCLIDSYNNIKLQYRIRCVNQSSKRENDIVYPSEEEEAFFEEFNINAKHSEKPNIHDDLGVSILTSVLVDQKNNFIVNDKLVIQVELEVVSQNEIHSQVIPHIMKSKL